MSIDQSAIEMIQRVFLPYYVKKSQEFNSASGRFAYYTTADTALKIIQNQEIWMRSTQTMNDFMEVEHGLHCLDNAIRSPAGEAFNSALDTCFPGLSSEVMELFRVWVPLIRTDTYVTCVSVHERHEDLHGRLSMWRAYGGSAGVALILNSTPFFAPTDALGAYSNPVAYMNWEGFSAELQAIASNILSNVNHVRSLGQVGLKNSVFQLLRFATVCTKHPAFAEENEWRVVASPTVHPSQLLPPAIETIGGVPQTVLKIKLQDHVERGLVGLSPNSFLERVLIGPCEHPHVIQSALLRAMSAAGIDNSHARIFQTGIPLRANQR